MEPILVTGGAGYIGSHIVLALKDRGFPAVVLDNLSTGHHALVPGDVPFIEADLRDRDTLANTIRSFGVRSVVHCAAALLVEESVRRPLEYYRNNVDGALALAEACAAGGIREVILSSTAAVYGTPSCVPVREDAALAPINPYGASKAMMERIFADLSAVTPDLAVARLRYFNVAGADPNLRAGQPAEKATHLVTAAVEYAQGLRPDFAVFGIDWETRDGTAERDYIHVTDLADAHLETLLAMRQGLRPEAMNVGYGHGATVLEVLDAVRRVTGKPLADVRLEGRRPGDPARLVADPTKLQRLVGWRPRLNDLDEIVRSAAAWARIRSSICAF